MRQKKDDGRSIRKSKSNETNSSSSSGTAAASAACARGRGLAKAAPAAATVRKAVSFEHPQETLSARQFGLLGAFAIVCRYFSAAVGLMSRSASCPSTVVWLEVHQGKGELSGYPQSRNHKRQNVHIGHVKRNIGNYTEKRRHRREHRLCPAKCCHKRLVSIDMCLLAWD